MKIKSPVCRILTAIIWVSVMTGCSVKEERGDCPCRLFLDFTAVDFSARAPLSLYVTSFEGFEHKEFVETDDTCVIDVPRTDLQIVVWSGDEGLINDAGLMIPNGRECPPLYIHSSILPAFGEAVFETVQLRKNHCVLTVDFVEPDDVVAMTVRGEVAGFDRYGNPVEGDFHVDVLMDSVSDLPVSCCLPRQIGGPLYLEVTDMKGRERTFPLYEYMRIVGYDWSESDLKDLSLVLDYSEAKVSVIIQGWKEEIILDVVI